MPFGESLHVVGRLWQMHHVRCDDRLQWLSAASLSPELHSHSQSPRTKQARKQNAITINGFLGKLTSIQCRIFDLQLVNGIARVF